MNPYDSVTENKVAEYAGSKYAVAVDCCSHAIFLACKWCNVSTVTIPKRTYVSIPCEIIHAGGTVEFDDTQGIDFNRNQIKTAFNLLWHPYHGGHHYNAAA